MTRLLQSLLWTVCLLGSSAICCADDRAAPAVGRQANLVALARLHWLVTTYHPSEEVLRIDWDARLLQAIPAAESAKDDDALIGVLRGFVEGLPDPAVEIRLTDPPPPTVPDWLRTGPEVELCDDVLYVALSPGDCCPSAIPEIEEAMKGRTLAYWVLDLRHTSGRTFGSLYSEVKVTLDWMLRGPARTPPRRGRSCEQTTAGPRGEQRVRFTDYPPREYAEGPGIAGDLAVYIVVDETTHSAAGGWLLGLCEEDLATIVGQPMNVIAEKPHVEALTDTLEAAMPLTRYLTSDGKPRTDPRLIPDRRVSFPADARGCDLVDLLREADSYEANRIGNSTWATSRPSETNPTKRVRSATQQTKHTQQIEEIAGAIRNYAALRSCDLEIGATLAAAERAFVEELSRFAGEPGGEKEQTPTTAPSP